MGVSSLGMCPKSLYTRNKLVDLTLSNQINLMDVSSSASLPSLLYDDSESTPVDLASKLPLAITSEILLKLHAESIVRCRCVSKLCSSITLDPYFINKFETRSASRPSLLMFFKKKDKLFVFSFLQHDSKNMNLNESRSYTSQHVESYNMKYPKNYLISDSVHGLICFRKSDSNPIIWNPSTRQLVTLPKPGKRWKDCLNFFLGYDPIEGKHKVVCLRRAKDFTECRVLTLGSARESWRTVKTNHKHIPCNWFHEQCFNGVIYYHAYHFGSDDDSFIMSFDVRTEKFDIINYPLDGFPFLLIYYEGKLAGIEFLENNIDSLILWTLEDAKRHKWSHRYFSTPFFRSCGTVYGIAGCTDTGEFIFIQRKLLNSFFILYFDPVKNSIRRVEFNGITDENFRFSLGLGSKRLSDFYIRSNHVETLMPL